ncbi:MAG TPA: hypothetical protein V6C81_29110 [Planktothrix sp.]|jgi:hypothetical protein
MEVLTKEEELKRAIAIYDAMLVDEELEKLMDGADEVSVNDGQVKHGFEHALNVGGRVDHSGQAGLTWHISDTINRIRPGSISLWDQILAGAGGMGHDSGRSISVKDHDKHSAVLMHHYLIALCQRKFGGKAYLPARFRKRVVQLCRMHRAESWLYVSDEEKARRKKEIDGADMALLLLADKLCGSESRVPLPKLRLLKRLANFKVDKRFLKKWNLDEKWTPARISWGHPDEIAAAGYSEQFIAEVVLKLTGPKDVHKRVRIPKDVELDHHDQVNGSIEDRVITIFADDRIHETEPTHSKYWGTMLYKMTVNEGIATQQLVTGLDWWGEAFHVSAKAAKYLGLRFLIEFNGNMLAYDRLAKNWVRIDGRHA